MKSLRILAFAFATFSTATAFAQAPTIWSPSESLFRNPASVPTLAIERPKGWHWVGSGSGNFSLTTSQDVVGQTNGSSQTYGLNFKGGVNRFSAGDEWRTELALRESTTKTANLGRFIKSEDELKLSTIYLYYLPNHPEVGPYVRGEAAAPIFKGEDVQPDDVTYRIEGTSETYRGSTLRLTDGFKPFTTKQAVGFFYRPVDVPKFHLEGRIGYAALQIAADGQLARKGKNDADEQVVARLNSVSQSGLEAGLSVRGLVDEKTSYELGIDSLTPFTRDRPKTNDQRSAWRLTNVDAFAKLTSKITNWASFGYDYKLRLQPQLVDRAQQIHMVTLNINFM